MCLTMYYRLLDSQVLTSSAGGPGFNPQSRTGKMVPVVPLFSTEPSKGKILALRWGKM